MDTVAVSRRTLGQIAYAFEALAQITDAENGVFGMTAKSIREDMGDTPRPWPTKPGIRARFVRWLLWR